MLGELSTEQRARITNWLVSQRHAGISEPFIDSESLQQAKTMPLRKVTERVDRLVLWFERRLGGLGRNLPIGYVKGYSDTVLLQQLTDELSSDIGSQGVQETIEVLEFSMDQGFVEAGAHFTKHQGGFFSLSFKGHARAEELKSVIGQSEQAFVAMWFGSQMDECYEYGFKSAIEDAGYRPMRIDRKEHNNKIDDEIIAEIRRSKFVVADFTSEIIAKSELSRLPSDTAIARGGVYFEAGFAKGLGKEVIWTVREDLINLVHFDTRQFAHITWLEPKDLREQLSARISATMGDGPLKKKS